MVAQRDRQAAAAASDAAGLERQAQLLTASPGPDDELDGTDEERDHDEANLVAGLTAAVESSAPSEVAADDALWAREQELLDAMQEIAQASRYEPDAKLLALIDWIREHQCPGLPEFGRAPKGEPPAWTERRVLIFTENREGTKRYLQTLLERAISGTDRAEERIAVITGLTSGPLRTEIQRRFNTDPAEEPMRILIATDAAREGLNFQAHCTDLFHFDLPWNPGRIEQRNGRIDRKLQPAPEVRCHYFVLPQRVEDHVLDVLVRKTETIRAELGSLSQVIDEQVQTRLAAGSGTVTRTGWRRRSSTPTSTPTARGPSARSWRRRVSASMNSSGRSTAAATCWRLAPVGTVRSAPVPRRAQLPLALLGAEPLREGVDERGRPVWAFPALDARAASDPSWAATLDTLGPAEDRAEADRLAA